MAKLNEIEVLIRADKWLQARAAIEAALCDDPEDHWLLTRLGLTFYEMHDYPAALKCEERAFPLEPNCPLVLWDFAGSLQMLNRHHEAVDLYRRLTRKGPKRIANGPCGEGIGRARGLVADCHYRISKSLDAFGRKDEALQEFETHLDLRGPGCFSIYALGELHRPEKNQINRRPGPNSRNGRSHKTSA